jgi:mRNA interferase MazF
VKLDEAGLNVSCMVRLKLFTLDNRLIARCIGHLSPLDREKTAQQLHLYLALTKERPRFRKATT